MLQPRGRRAAGEGGAPPPRWAMRALLLRADLAEPARRSCLLIWIDYFQGEDGKKAVGVAVRVLLDVFSRLSLRVSGFVVVQAPSCQ